MYKKNLFFLQKKIFFRCRGFEVQSDKGFDALHLFILNFNLKLTELLIIDNLKNFERTFVNLNLKKKLRF